MKILLTGATGLVGRDLVKALSKQGHSLHLLTRNPERAKMLLGMEHRYFQWDALESSPPKEAYEKVDVIVNLMGEGVADKRWTRDQKKKIRDSRVKGTRLLLQGVDQKGGLSLKTLISASAIGFYELEGNEILNEEAAVGTGFLAELCAAWEMEVTNFAKTKEIREVRIRVGVVLGKNGGALAKLIPLFKKGLGGVLGSGQQWMNWIHIDDLVAIFQEAIENNSMQGVFNAVAPGNVKNKEFTKILGQVLRKPTFLAVPSLVLKIAVGEMADFLLKGQKVVSKRLSDVSFRFKFHKLQEALDDILI